jgi:gluconolactonase
MRLVYSVSRPGRALQEWMAFRETMAAFPSGTWTGAGADNPWTVTAADPAHVQQGTLSNFGEGNPCGLELRNGTDSQNDTMVETALGIDARGDAGRVEFWLRADGLGGGDGWTFQLDGGSGFETRLSELEGQSHGWRFYRCELREGELVGALGMRFQFRGGDPGASVRLDQIYVNVSSEGAPAEEFELAMLDDGEHGDGKAGDGIFGARIPAFPERTRVGYYIAAAASGGASTRDPAGAPAIYRGYTVAEGAAALTFGPLPDTGQAGDFTSSPGEDSDYTINAPSFTDNGDGTVTDAVTGLLWQKGDGGEAAWEKARSYADGLVLGGYDDWRLPSSHELFCLQDLGRHDPALDTGIFTKTAAEHYWAADASAGDAGMAWAVDGGGGIAPHRKTGDPGAGGRFHVRCVRDGNTATAPTGDFTANGDGTATSAATGLVWQSPEAPSDMTWEGALAYCEGLVLGGRDDWRLPNAKELRSLANDTRSGPSLNSTAFPGARPSAYWTSTTDAGDQAKAWTVDFGQGAAAGSAKTAQLPVRAVRGGYDGTGVQVALPEMVSVPGGTFDMGDHSGLGGGSPGNASDEEPLHDVTLDGFSIGRFEVTNAQYCAFLNDERARGAVLVSAGGVFPAGGTTPLCGLGPEDPSSSLAWDGQRFSVLGGRMAHPATGIRWEGAAAYCNWLGVKEGFAAIYDLGTGAWNRTAAGYRLPTEAEWEWAALGGRNGSYPVFPWGDDPDAARANWPDSSDPYEAGSRPWTTPAGFYDGSLRRKSGLGWPAGPAAYLTGNGSNPLGLHDLAGNVREWVNDIYNSEYYSFCPHVNPPGPENGTLMPDGKAYHSLRGGSWLEGLFGQSRISDRSSGYFAGAPGARYSDVGFRVALVEARGQNSLVAPGSAPERLAGADRPFDGPAADAAGNLYFTEPERDLIHLWSVGGNLSVFRNGTGGATGLAFESGGSLVACEAGGRLVARLDPARPALNATVLAALYDGKAFNGPDDLWVDPKGGIYFTDPAPRNGTRSQDGEHVYYLAPGATTPVLAVRDLARPGGLAGTDDGRTLYLSDIGTGLTYRYSVLADGSLSGKELFVPLGSAGTTLDERGNVYLTERSVLVFDAGGSRLAEIAVPARPTGLEFGGSDRRTLFITTEKGLYGVRMAVGGIYRFDSIPDPIPQVFINEIKRDSENGTGRPVFWVELFNNGTAPVDLGGMHLTNDLARPAAWTIPANTTMAARGFLVFWADNEPARGPLHAGFELDAAGGLVALFCENGTLVDSMAFGPLPANASYGRYTDGSDTFIVMHDHPSPGSPNVPDDPDVVDPGGDEPPAGKPRTITIGGPDVRYVLPVLIAAIAAVAAGLFMYGRRLDRKGPGTAGWKRQD